MEAREKDGREKRRMEGRKGRKEGKKEEKQICMDQHELYPG